MRRSGEGFPNSFYFFNKNKMKNATHTIGHYSHLITYGCENLREINNQEVQSTEARELLRDLRIINARLSEILSNAQ